MTTDSAIGMHPRPCRNREFSREMRARERRRSRPRCWAHRPPPPSVAWVTGRSRAAVCPPRRRLRPATLAPRGAATTALAKSRHVCPPLPVAMFQQRWVRRPAGALIQVPSVQPESRRGRPFACAPATGPTRRMGTSSRSTVPHGLDGICLRNTENRPHPALKTYHPFDGDGMLDMVGFRDGKAFYHNRFVRTDGRRANSSSPNVLSAARIRRGCAARGCRAGIRRVGGERHRAG